MESVICLDRYVERLINYIKSSDEFIRILILQPDRYDFMYETDDYWVYKISADLIQVDRDENKILKVTDEYGLTNIKLYCDIGLLYFKLDFKCSLEFVVETNSYIPSELEKIETNLLRCIDIGRSVRPLNIQTYNVLLFMNTLSKEHLEERLKTVDILYNSSYTNNKYTYIFDYTLLYLFSATELIHFMCEVLERERSGSIVERVVVRISCENGDKSKELLKWTENIYNILYKCYRLLESRQINWKIYVFGFYGNVENYQEIEAYCMDKLKQDGSWFEYKTVFHSNC